MYTENDNDHNYNIMTMMIVTVTMTVTTTVTMTITITIMLVLMIMMKIMLMLMLVTKIMFKMIIIKIRDSTILSSQAELEFRVVSVCLLSNIDQRANHLLITLSSL